jgi:hypothetical protein
LPNPHPATAARALGVALDPRRTRIGRAATTATIARAATARMLPMRYPVMPLGASTVPPSRLALAGPDHTNNAPPTVRDISRLTVDSPPSPAGQSYVIAVLEMLRSEPTPTAIGELARLAPQAELDSGEIDRIHRTAIIGLWRQITLERRPTETDAATITSLARHLGVPDVFDRLEIHLDAVSSDLTPVVATPVVATAIVTAPVVTTPVVTTPVVEPTPIVVATPPAGWYADPLQRHTYRWWDGTRWTIKAATNGATIDDPF